jgi:hypothetical protein
MALVTSLPVMAMQSSPAATVTIEFTNDKLQPPHWLLTLHEDGAGEFESDKSGPSTDEANRIAIGAIHRPIHLSAAYTAQVFATARQRRLFDFPCESHLKVAFQGNKRLSYSGPEGVGTCQYNYSKDKEIQALGDSLLGVASMIVYGARLEKLLQHDRLGLDLAMENLVDAVHDGNAREAGAIRETLERIANDDQVLDRARRRARTLLAQAQ